MPDCGTWEVKKMCDQEDGCGTNGTLPDWIYSYELYWCCDPEAEKEFWDAVGNGVGNGVGNAIGKAVGTVLLWLSIGIVAGCIAICRCWYRRRARMAHTATAHAIREPLIVVEPEMMASGVEIQATATQVNPKVPPFDATCGGLLS